MKIDCFFLVLPSGLPSFQRMIQYAMPTGNLIGYHCKRHEKVCRTWKLQLVGGAFIYKVKHWLVVRSNFYFPLSFWAIHICLSGTEVYSMDSCPMQFCLAAICRIYTAGIKHPKTLIEFYYLKDANITNYSFSPLETELLSAFQIRSLAIYLTKSQTITPRSFLSTTVQCFYSLTNSEYCV